MIKKLKKDVNRIIASYLRAVAVVVGGVQMTNAFGGRGWSGVWQGLALALIAPTIRGLETIASTIEEG